MTKLLDVSVYVLLVEVEFSQFLVYSTSRTVLIIITSRFIFFGAVLAVNFTVHKFVHQLLIYMCYYGFFCPSPGYYCNVSRTVLIRLNRHIFQWRRVKEVHDSIRVYCSWPSELRNKNACTDKSS